jgi:hypothetical protein
VLVALALAAVVALFAIVNRDYRLDDALIYQRYLKHALEGQGLVYNVGERFNALTSPLYTYVSLLTARVFGAIRPTMIAQAAVFHLGTIALLYAVFVRHERRWAFVLFGAALVAVSRYFYAIYGMESPLFLLLCAACLWLYELRDTFWLGIACALLLLVRGEGLFLVLALAGAHLLRRRPIPPPSHFVLPALLIGANLAFNRLYYGSLLPHTLSAKIDQGRSGLWGEGLLFFDVGYQLEYFADSVLLFAVLAGLAVLGVLRLGRRDINLVVLAFLGALTLFYLVLGVPNYHWYYAPFYAFGCMYAGLGLAWLYDRARLLRPVAAADAARAVVCAVGVAVLVASAWATWARPLSDDFRQRQYPEIGRWLARNTPEDASVAMVEVGLIGFYSDRRIVDILGLVSPGNAAALGERRFGAWVRRYEPDFVLVHDPLWPHEQGVIDAVRRGEYRVHRAFRFPGYALLARADETPGGRMRPSRERGGKGPR